MPLSTDWASVGSLFELISDEDLDLLTDVQRRRFREAVDVVRCGIAVAIGDPPSSKRPVLGLITGGKGA